MNMTPEDRLSPFAEVPNPAEQMESADSLPQHGEDYGFEALAPEPAARSDDFFTESAPIRQLELRAIFGVDHELSAEEMIRRARALPGVRVLARLGAQEFAMINGLKDLLPKLGFSNGPLKVYIGTTPIDFIREGTVVLAVQTDGAFAPGVREALMIVARELGRLA